MECWKKIRSAIKQNALLYSTLLAVGLGVALGLSLRLIQPNDDVIMIIGIPGDVFLRVLRMLVLPIMVASIITGSATLSGKAEGKVALCTFVIFIATSLIASLIGLLFVALVHPGNLNIKSSATEPKEQFTPNMKLLDTFLDLFRNALPENLVEACVKQIYTKYEENPYNNKTFSRKLNTRPGTNALGLIVFSLVFGVTLGTLRERSQIMIKFFIGLDKTVMKLVLKVMWLTPIGVLSLVCSKLLAVSNITTLLQQMAVFVASVLGALTTEVMVAQPLLFFFVTRENPYIFLVRLLQAMVTAFAVSSSSVTMPVTLRCLEEKCKVDRRVTRFVVPLGTTINMNGTALFITMSTFFIAQMNGIPLQAGDYLAVVITATAVSVAATSVPSSSLFLMVMCLSAIGAPVSDVSLLFAVEWINDRSRTINNVIGDAFASGMVAHLCRKDLENDDNTDDLTVRASNIM
ncbi:excitatory amino acid transporter 2-like [Tachypleus tridentatus]|uniref:excitatory amino acid transporter 2-like n=1 Tax=Tachypleus tridentatus TaxID=6853 RepID=UPI003FD02563